VRRVILYSFEAKNIPTSIRQNPAPNGSSTTPFKPEFTNFAGIPNTVSDPNQVANVVVTIMIKGKWRPAMAKSAVFFTLLAATRPIAMVIKRYPITRARSINALRGKNIQG
jgi:hypothetical protein